MRQILAQGLYASEKLNLNVEIEHLQRVTAYSHQFGWRLAYCPSCAGTTFVRPVDRTGSNGSNAAEGVNSLDPKNWSVSACHHRL